ncbi:hypothetical protein A3F07_01915 [candidate division WWE3 bacterium RIFCSPHIGHO2_12_FULL_38_15]|uniref:AAA+ ATPase domain-containing protein n=1 Tax=candidate division WWE3 bacterium RIFCSPHIGHO2_02_FULL_38_14 TaxID=1802620 RepID=A0A1F4V8B7_UNCKA|nr:MAG: hypothetical protein A2793_03150 [candidate division WWE3 bacterium RIFCSPHIGHO2_01_FULL_38_45]OGC48637.1 MAG: hypothetical protein A3F07_01915 [candidate division WWE3 bacterium RIFCSPHIGHO2_12_FULL_38_15]OGC53043.1 MAG: hypothetical protein A3B64_01175 [candidate division WWE3 bacterium RIFCSPLOWO2_01_FULL_37_24]OGC53406.1 MAG: hypothetical protein A3D91_00030 [candidate division WWE3 bacterium RIFCSPHIGHO2_02_FULL_38_14]HLB51880.1 ATP-binding protein [Patescibacteria group bacterium]
MATYKDQFLESLYQVFLKNPDDQHFKKYFGLELYKKGELKEAYKLLKEVYAIDKDINIERALKDIEEITPQDSSHIGFISETPTKEQLIEMIPEFKASKVITFADVAGMEGVKDEIRTLIIYPFQHPEIYKQYNKQAGGGILLYGPPGCGKTFIAKATAGEINAKFLSVSIHELMSSFAGVGEKALHDIFEWARSNAPAILFFDEIDAIGMSRSKTSGVLRTLVNQFLTELDGLGSNNENILVMGATNLPWEVDTALRRPGRFDKVLFVTPPDIKARQRIIELELKDKPKENINYEELAEMTKGYSSADVRRICDEAGDEAFKKSIKTGQLEKITQESLVERIKLVKSSITDWFSTVKNYIQYSNESGLYNDVKDYLDLSVK